MSPVGVNTSNSNRPQKTTAPKLWLLMVGVNHYQDEQLPNLRYSAVDCQGLAEALVDATTHFTTKEVNIYHDFAPQPPTLENLRLSLEHITAIAQPQDTILFYFSGHGMIMPNTQQAFLCLANTDKEDLENTALSLQDILQLFSSSAAQQQLVWLDACHSGIMTLRGGSIGDRLLNPSRKLVEILQKNATKSKGFYALLSCDQDQQSWEFPELGHGVFTYYLIRGLRGEAADSQSVIDIYNLYRYVFYQTLQYIDNTNQQLRLINQQRLNQKESIIYSEYSLQTPKLILEGVGELVLGRKSASVSSSQEKRVAVVVEGISANKTTLEISKLLGSNGGYSLEYLKATKASTSDVKNTITRHLHSNAEPKTILLYLRGRIYQREGWSGFVLGDNNYISRLWLKQQLRGSHTTQQIIILDCIGNIDDAVLLRDCLEDLQLDIPLGQCLIGCVSTPSEPQIFAQTLLDILMASSLTKGLSAAGAISQIQLSLAGTGVTYSVWLSSKQGIIEIFPAIANQNREKHNQGLDLGICPYMGLNAFSPEDAQYFYGRENLTQQLIYKLTNSSFLAVVGASGSGKSSLVQAGVIPQLRLGKQIPNSEKWLIATLRPGTNPLEVLAQQLAGLSTQEETFTPASVNPLPLAIEGIFHQGVEGFVYWIRTLHHPIFLLVIDQFEELFTLTSTPDREKFLELLLGALKYAPDRFKLIITLRADFISSCLEIPALAQILQESNVLVPAKLSQDDYRRAIAKPAQQVGLKIEPELVEVLLRELNTSASDLPLLEFVLEQLWQHRQQGKLTLQAYQQQLGGIQGALERSCQAVYESLDIPARECAKWIFLSLTQLGSGKEDTRRRILKSDLVVAKYPPALVQKTLQAFTAAKLIVVNLEENQNFYAQSRGDEEKQNFLSPENITAQVTVEVAHEILIRHWSTLRWWLEENRDRLRKQRQIEQACQMWLQSGEQADFLLQGVRLLEAEDIYIKYTSELSADVQRFIEACLTQRKQQQLREKTRQLQTQRRAIALFILGILALGLGGLAWWKGREAQLREITALNSASAANLLSNQQLEALRASVQAAQESKKIIGLPEDIRSQTMTGLQAVLSEIQESNRLSGHKAKVLSAKFSPDGKIIASVSVDQTIKIWNTEGKLIKTLSEHQAAVSDISFSADSKILASASEDKTIKLWRISDSHLLKTLKGHSETVNNISFSPDGKTIASASVDRTIKIWNVSTGRLLKTLNGHSDDVISISFSPDGKTIASAGNDKIIKLWNTSDGRPIKNLKGHNDFINSVAFSPDGKTIASASADKTVKLWDINSDRLLKNIAGDRSFFYITFSPDGKKIAGASRDTTIKLWNSSGIEIETFKGHQDEVNSVYFSPDGQSLVSASGDFTIRIWKSQNRNLQQIFTGHNKEVYKAIFTVDGKTIISGGSDGTITFWRPSDETPFKTIPAHNDTIDAMSLSLDGQLIASASADKTVKIWRISDGNLLKTKRFNYKVNSITFSPDSKILATAGTDKTIELWNRNGSLLKTLKGHDADVSDISFSPDGQIIASASNDKTVKIWDIHSNKLLRTLWGHQDWVHSVTFNSVSTASPEGIGKIIASTSLDKTTKLWRSNDGTLLHTLKGHKSTIYTSSFSPDGKMLATGSEDKTIKLWLLDGRLLATLKAHSAAVSSVNFSPDSRNMVSSSSDGTIKLWRIDNLQMQNLKMDVLIQNGCNWLNNYLANNPNVKPNEKLLCPSDSQY